ncbi:MAG: ABC transporter permease [Synechococcales cyanobacterium CRU_2_2]|nr:ABC transporter permease [Synechococcales cyanobacterium CRU_2_2]
MAVSCGLEKTDFEGASFENTDRRNPVLTRIPYLLKETLLGLLRGGWMNWAAVSTVTVLLFLLGLGLQTTWQVEKLANQFGSQLEVSAFLKTGVDAKTLTPFVQKMPGVAAIGTVSKDEAWATMAQELGLADVKGATEQLSGNPLVDEIRVKARSPQILPTLVNALRQLDGVDEVQYLPEVLQRLNQLNQGLNWLGLAIVTLLTSTALAVITTTIRLIVVARRREIEIMQLVGATSLWIALPFILQGLVFGLVGGALGWGGVAIAQLFLRRLVANQPELLQSLAQALQLDASQTLMLPLILLGFGGGVGILGSLLAVGPLSSQR